jgi:hypothetical protein
MDEGKRAELLEEAYMLLEHELLLSKPEQQDQLRFVRRQIVIARTFKRDAGSNEVGFSDFLRQSILLIVRLMIELFAANRS